MDGGVRWAVVVAGLVGAVLAGSAAGEVDAPLATPVVVDPDGCLVEPRPVPEIVELVGTVAPGEEAPTPVATPVPAPSSAGAPADAATAAAVTATLVEVAACTDAGEFARAYALSTDDFLRRTVGPLTEERLALLEGVGFPNAEERAPTTLTVTDIRLLEDGRAVAVARVASDEVGAPRMRGFVLRLEGDRWLLDATFEMPPLGTPTA